MSTLIRESFILFASGGTFHEQIEQDWRRSQLLWPEETGYKTVYDGRPILFYFVPEQFQHDCQFSGQWNLDLSCLGVKRPAMRQHTTQVIGLFACVDRCRQHATRVTLVLPIRILLGLLLALLLLVPLLLVPLVLVPLILVPVLLVLLLLSLLLLVPGAPLASVALAW